jgi:phage terminase large subunit GpA-like protein
LFAHPSLRGTADAIGDPKIERVSIQKSARVGYTSLLCGGVASYIVNDPAPLLVVMPTEADARGIVVDDLENIFAVSPSLAGALSVSGLKSVCATFALVFPPMVPTLI